MTVRLHKGVYPVTVIPMGDDGKVKPFHILHCMSQPKCDAELRLSTGSSRALPAHAIVKQAHQRGWHADRRGYVLCPMHTPWAKRGGEPSALAPEQRRAAYCAIRERNMLLASNDTDPIKERNMELDTEQRDVLLERAETDPRLNSNQRKTLKALLPAIKRGDFTRGWQGRVAEQIGMNATTFSGNVARLVKHGYLAKVPNSTRLFALYATSTLTPTPEKETEMTEQTVVPMVKTTPPRLATLADNRRIREFLDDNYDDSAGRWCGDLSDAAAAERLKVPRAWVQQVRAAFYGDDTNEEADRRSSVAAELAADAAKLQEDALAIATRAEEIEKRARALMVD